jgi:hypothetical protein
MPQNLAEKIIWNFPCHPTVLVYFRKRTGIEPIIGHLKSDFRIMQNYLTGNIIDTINLMLGSAAFNFRKTAS